MQIRQHIQAGLLAALILLLTLPSQAKVYTYRQERLDHALVQAIRANNIPAALAALKAGADPNTRTYNTYRRNNLPWQWERLLRLHDPDLNTKWDHRYSALLLYLEVTWQADKEDPTFVKALLEAGADPNYRANCNTSSGDSPICSAVWTHKPRILRLLIAHGGKVNAKYENLTPLHMAAESGGEEIIKILLDNGADIKARTDEGWTPLHYASYRHQLDAIEALLSRHADVNARTKDGKTPLDSAKNEDLSDGEVILSYHSYHFPEYKAKLEKVIPTLRKSGAKTGKELDAEAAAAPKR